MAKELLAKNVPAKEIDKIEKAFKKLGATTKRIKNDDGTVDLEGSFPD